MSSTPSPKPYPPYSPSQVDGRPRVKVVQITNIVIRSPSDTAHPDLPEHIRLCVFIVADRHKCQGPAPASKEVAAAASQSESSWRVVGNIVLSSLIESFVLMVEQEYPPGKELGSVELFTANILQQPSGHDHDLVLVGEECDSPSLKLSFTSSVGFTNRVPLRPSPLFPESRDTGFLTHVCSFADSDYAEALRLPDYNPAKADLLRDVGAIFKKRHALQQNIMDLDKANLAYEKAVDITPDSDPRKPSDLRDLGNAFWYLFRLRGDTADGDKSIEAFEKAVRLTPETHPDKARHLGTLGEFYLRRLRHFSDIEMSIQVFKNAVRLTPEDARQRPTFLYGLARSLSMRFERLEDIADINESVLATEEAIRLAPDRDRHKIYYQKCLASTLLQRFQRLRDAADINKSVLIFEGIAKCTPRDPGSLNDLAGSLLRRFERFGDITDLDNSIMALEDAVKIPPVELQGAISLTPDRQVRLKRLANLGNSLRSRFNLLGNVADINRAILVVEEAVRLAPDDFPEKYGFLGLHGACLEARFRRLNNVADINMSVLQHQEAVTLAPNDDAYKFHLLKTLGTSLLNRFIGRNDIADLNEAILAQEYALSLTPHDHPGRPSRLTGLGISLMHRFQQLGDIADIDQSILFIEDSVECTQDDDPAKCQRLTYLGNTFLERYRSLRHRNDFDNAITQFSRVARSSTGPPSVRLNGAMNWARMALKNDASHALDAYAIVINLLPRVAWLGLTITERHRLLSNIGSTVTEAAAIAIEHEKYATAVEWLDHGRSIIWGQLLHLRTPVDELHEVEPELADRLKQISHDLEHASTRNEFVDQNGRLSMEQAAQQHRRLAKQWDDTVEKVRAVGGFEDFLRPKKLQELRNAARLGPVVVLNIHKRRCDALVITVDSDDVIHIPLDRFSYNRSQLLQRSLSKLLTDANVRMRSSRQLSNKGGVGFETILSELWIDVVKPVLDFFGFPISGGYELPHIWWCATGPLTFLPIHAAGVYDTGKSGSKISDFIISSYTTTLTAILEKPREMPRRFQGLAVVTQPKTPGSAPLPGTKEELIRIQSYTKDLRMESLPGEKATVENVLSSMKICSWIHLACHAVQVLAEPTKSGFLLHNGALDLSEIIKLSLPHADFAFLSACQTATGHEKLSEEATHLAAGMVSAGYRSVIATMWSISDKQAPLLADDVYSELLKDGEPDSTRAAYALHHAVKSLRQRTGESSFLSWVPFIHVGI